MKARFPYCFAAILVLSTGLPVGVEAVAAASAVTVTVKFLKGVTVSRRPDWFPSS